MDREKVIKVLECCLNGSDCRNCPYADEYKELDCITQSKTDALELLKEQEKLLNKKQRDINKLCKDYSELKHKFHEKTELVRCKDCKHYKDGRCFFTMRRYGLHEDWFCADGERKSD